ncbi:MAG: SUMF1/EgtB/PvdO family nonheme iron enzyme [Armatimonadota bacterium]|nr:SUMF1/EgtB/PvdO family nonheme iron enzyme [Armatimonadota bacterium]
MGTLRVVHLRLRDGPDECELGIDYQASDLAWVAAGRSRIDRDTVDDLIQQVEARRARMTEGQELGQALYDALLGNDATRIVWREAESAAEDEPVRLCLSADESDLQHQLDLVATPWDGLYDGRNHLWLGSRRGVLYRMPWRPENTCRPGPELRVLVVHTTPLDAERPFEERVPPLKALDTKALRDELDELAEQTCKRLRWREADAQIDDLTLVLSDFRPDVVHFVGHSLAGTDDDPRPVLVFVDGAGRATCVTPSQLGQCFHSADWYPRLVVLTSCRSAQFAVELLREGNPVVVGCRYKVNDREAKRLDSAIYRALARGAAIDQAVAEGRRAVIDSPEAWCPADWMGPFVATSLDPRAPLVLYDVQADAPEPEAPRPVGVRREAKARRGGTLAAVLAIAGLLMAVAGAWLLLGHEEVPPGMVLVPATDAFTYGCQDPAALEAAVHEIEARAQERWRHTIQQAREQGQEVTEEAEEEEIAILTHNLWVMANQYANLPSGSKAMAPFLIDSHEVSNAEWAEYLAAEVSAPVPMDWGSRSCPQGRESEPVGGITFAAAQAYAQWRGKRLPTTDEWEYAAAGGRATLFPWGNSPDPALANVRESWGVDAVPRPRPVTWGEPYTFGLYNMSGNVSEWTVGAEGEPALCGGDYQESMVSALVFRRTTMAPGSQWPEVGFRCAADPPGRQSKIMAGALLLVGLILAALGVSWFRAGAS